MDEYFKGILKLFCHSNETSIQNSKEMLGSESGMEAMPLTKRDKLLCTTINRCRNLTYVDDL